ncbi:MAG: rRNA pseudouridine synthase [Bacilli bacterium]|nr:rRNA pseudouridine synthase [Bacilli bacterium]
MERLQKFIAEAGYTSRRKAEELIKQGKVEVNGRIVTELGFKIGGKEQVIVEGNLLKKEEKEYYLLNKPRSIITSVSDDKGRKTVVDLVDSQKRIYPIGRLDYDTTGVLLLTNDGEFANILMHPNNQIDKVYIAKLRGLIRGNAINKLKNGVMIDGRKTKKCRVKLRKIDLKNNTSIVEITIHEGRNHQIKKMFREVGFEVLKLKRERIGIFTLQGLKTGSYRKLSPKEVSVIYSLQK